MTNWPCTRMACDQTGYHLDYSFLHDTKASTLSFYGDWWHSTYKMFFHSSPLTKTQSYLKKCFTFSATSFGVQTPDQVWASLQYIENGPQCSCFLSLPNTLNSAYVIPVNAQKITNNPNRDIFMMHFVQNRSQSYPCPPHQSAPTVHPSGAPTPP